MDFGFLAFLAEPWFVVPWYVLGGLGALWVAYDEITTNTRVTFALKWAWPIIVFFFSLPGLALYWWTCRPPDIDKVSGAAEKRVHHDYVSTPFRKVTGSVIHCVGGDGLGIVTAMVIARLLGFNFWQEFWFEYAVGFAFGWFIFQYMAMRDMADSWLEAMWMGGRAEFFSMITVMAGMGIVMGLVTPFVVGEQPKPYTVAFWGFAALGLLLGAVVTYPTNWLLVQIGWKHGMH